MQHLHSLDLNSSLPMVFAHGIDEISDRRCPTDSVRPLEQGLGETRPAARYFSGGATLRARNLS